MYNTIYSFHNLLIYRHYKYLYNLLRKFDMKLILYFYE